MANLYTTKNEEYLISAIKKEGLGCREQETRDLPKYVILRIAIGLALRLEKIKLDSPLWETKKMIGERGGEYHLATILGGVREEENILKAILYIRHRDEIDECGRNIFEDERFFIGILDKYIHRGLFEISNTWKSKDCFYQWCLDHLGFQNAIRRDSIDEIKEDVATKIEDYYRKQNVPIDVVNELDSLRHRIYRIKVKDDSRLRFFEKESKDLEKILGVGNASIKSCNHLGMASTFDILIGKPKQEWKKLGIEEFNRGIQEAKSKELGILAGYTAEGEPFVFDLIRAKHLIVGGSTGSGKTTFIQCLILSLLISSQDCEIVFIDPKCGLNAGPFKDCSRVEIISEPIKAVEYLRKKTEEMDERYEEMSKTDTSPINKVIVVDELNDLILQDKETDTYLSRLALKARQAGIYLVLGTQRPDASTLSGNLRSNIVSRIALKVTKSRDSQIILDEVGAEKLLGEGDMLVKIDGEGESRRVFGIYLDEKQIRSMIPREFLS